MLLFLSIDRQQNSEAEAAVQPERRSGPGGDTGRGPGGSEDPPTTSNSLGGSGAHQRHCKWAYGASSWIR